MIHGSSSWFNKKQNMTSFDSVLAIFMQKSRKTTHLDFTWCNDPKTNHTKACHHNTGVLTDARADLQVIHHQGFCIRNFYTDVPFFFLLQHIYLSENMIYHSFVPTEVGQQSAIRFFGLFSCLFSLREGYCAWVRTRYCPWKSCFWDISQLRGWLVVDVFNNTIQEMMVF